MFTPNILGPKIPGGRLIRPRTKLEELDHDTAEESMEVAQKYMNNRGTILKL